MILKHPLNRENEANKQAIEKYKDRLVYVYYGKFGLWLKNNPSAWWGSKEERKIIDFKSALKLTKNYKTDSKIEYHFIDELGEEKTPVSEYDEENIFNCTSVIFDNADSRKYKPS